MKRMTARASELESIYSDYPRKVGRKKALESISKAIDDISSKQGIRDPIAFLRSRVKEFAKSVSGIEEKYLPHPMTWFNQGRYDDPITSKSTLDPKFKPTGKFPDQIRSMRKEWSGLDDLGALVKYNVEMARVAYQHYGGLDWWIEKGAIIWRNKLRASLYFEANCTRNKASDIIDRSLPTLEGIKWDRWPRVTSEMIADKPCPF